MADTLTAGAQALANWLAAHERTGSWLAEKLGCSRSAVALWLSGARRPAEPLRGALEALTGIAATAWLSADERALGERAERTARLLRGAT